MKLSEAVALYIKLRDECAEKKKAYTEEVEAIKQKMAKIEVAVMSVMDKAGTESINTEFGTAYRALQTSATVADREAFLNFCREHDEWTLMDVRAAKGAIEQYKSANDEQLPPGINWRAERVVNFRRPA